MRRLDKLIKTFSTENGSESIRDLYFAQLAELKRVGYTTEEAANALNYKPVTDNELQRKIDIKIKAERQAEQLANEKAKTEIDALINWINNE